jgi:hypothetical protein
MKHKEYHCKLSNDGFCRYGGNKPYNYGFTNGSAGYCYKSRKWISDMRECPLVELREFCENKETETENEQ